MADEFFKCAEMYQATDNYSPKLSLHFLRHAFDLYLRSGHTKKNQLDSQFLETIFARPPYDPKIIIEPTSLKATMKKITSVRNRLKRILSIDSFEPMDENDLNF